MDPVTELATRVASYLWRLRDIYPTEQTLAEIATDCVSLRHEASLIRRRTWNAIVPHRRRETVPLEARRLPDLALLSRVNDVVSRTREDALRIDRRFDRYPVDSEDPRNPDFWSPITAGLDQLKKSIRRRDGTILKNVAELGRTLNPPEPDGGLENIGRVLGTFPFHAARLRRLLPEAPIPGGEHQRRESKDANLIARLGEMLLQKDPSSGGLMLWNIAEAINYLPSSLRGLTADQVTAILFDPFYPKELLKTQGERSLPFAPVLHAELDEIEKLRVGRGVTPRIVPHDPQLPEKRAYDMNLLGLAFSGGGIRSATFGLGVLQTLAAKGWLRQADYLSTVSGGGYIGAWLISWIKRVGSVQAVEQRLARWRRTCKEQGSDPDPASDLLRPIRMLREYSSYLTPKSGIFSADTWTMITIWIRNTLLNLTVLGLFLAGVLGLPRVALLMLTQFTVGEAVACAAVLMLSACVVIGLNFLKSFEVFSFRWWGRANQVVRLKGDGGALVAATIAGPLLASAFFATCALWILREDVQYRYIFVSTFGLFWLGLYITEARIESQPGFYLFLDRISNRETPHVAWAPLSAFAGAAMMTVACAELLPLGALNSLRGVWFAVAFGPGIILIVYSLTVTLYLGLLGYRFDDLRREWWSRLGAWLVLLGMAWTGVTSISFFAPLLVGWAALHVPVWTSSIGAAWTAITAVGARLGFSGSTGKNGAQGDNSSTSLLIKIAPPIFMIGFLILVAFGMHVAALKVAPLLQSLPDKLPPGLAPVPRAVVAWLAPLVPSGPALPLSWAREVGDYWPGLLAYAKLSVAMCLVFMVIAILLSAQVDVNEFSMHHFYRNRLVRAYLGASRIRRHRRPNQFTGLDPKDDIKLWRFHSDDLSQVDDDTSDCRPGYNGPYPIMNATLNLTGGEDLAWQERKGHSFFFTPDFCGFDLGLKLATIEADVQPSYGLRPTKSIFGLRKDSRNKGIGIGNAVAISGAAASPNWGYHTSTPMAFLLTVFNVRLGWWLGNPAQGRWSWPSPRLGLVYLLHELFGYANADRKFVYLSDGGHFDNMGLYELVRRRCRFIVLCDGEEDTTYSFEGLADAIRKCRLDFGVEIDLQPSAIKPAKDGDFSAAHWALGTVRYPDHDECGQILYVKSSLMGDEPADVIEYRSKHGEFPHQSTANQFFNESQFESYRALGQHVLAKILEEFPDETELDEVETYQLSANALRGMKLTKAFDNLAKLMKEQSTASAKKGDDA